MTLWNLAPCWEKHEDNADCWCEPDVRFIKGDTFVVHVAKLCRGGTPHRFSERYGACSCCGMPTPLEVVP